MEKIWATMDGKDHFIRYDDNMDVNTDFVRENIIEKKGLFVHTREMHS